MIYAGTLTEKLDIYTIEEVQSESGFKHTEEKYLYTVNAQRLKNKENYAVNADELFHNVELTFHLRYRKEINETCIVVYQGIRYRVISLDKYKDEITMTLDKIND